jgi:hypothetical protein
MHYVIGFILGLAVGVFALSVARKLHALFSKEAQKGAQFAEYVYKDIEKKL